MNDSGPGGVAASKLKGLAWLLFGLGLAAGFATALPWLAAGVPWSVERALARAVPTLQGTERCSGNPASTDALAALVARIYPALPGDAGLPLEIRVVRGETVNAFATLGGRIFVFDGLVQEAGSPEELAAVLAHELEHVRRRHIIQGFVSQAITSGLLSSLTGGGAELARIFMRLHFSRAQEAEADRGALERLASARIGVDGFVAFFERQAGKSRTSDIISDHPGYAERIALARSYLGRPVTPTLSAAQWRSLRAICH